MPMIATLRTRLRLAVLGLHTHYLRKIWKMDIAEGARISFKAKIDRTNPRGVHIGNFTGVAFDAVILTHDFTNNRHRDTRIGSCCQIGARSVIFPGVQIGDGCIVAAGSVVTTNIPDGCIVLGNPARVVERGIKPGKFGVRVDILPEARVDKRMVIEET